MSFKPFVTSSARDTLLHGSNDQTCKGKVVPAKLGIPGYVWVLFVSKVNWPYTEGDREDTISRPRAGIWLYPWSVLNLTKGRVRFESLECPWIDSWMNDLRYHMVTLRQICLFGNICWVMLAIHLTSSLRFWAPYSLFHECIREKEGVWSVLTPLGKLKPAEEKYLLTMYY